MTTDFGPALKAVLDASAQLVSWALAIAAGSVAGLLGTSYFSPRTRKGRLFYLLFAPGWLSLGLSVNLGDRLTRRFVAAHFVRSDLQRAIVEKMNLDYAAQSFWFTTGLLVFGAWLLIYLFWWVFRVDKSGATPGGGKSCGN